jgi:hypothetical protein
LSLSSNGGSSLNPLNWISTLPYVQGARARRMVRFCCASKSVVALIPLSQPTTS